MRKLIMLCGFLLFGMVFHANSAPPEVFLNMSVQPSRPVVGEPVVWSAIPRVNWTPTPGFAFTWVHEPQGDIPTLDLNPADFRFDHSITNTYTTSGTKTMIVEVRTGHYRKSITRSMSVNVAEGELSHVYVDHLFLEIGKTYDIIWVTRGNVPFVEVSILDDRYTGVPGLGEEILASGITNVDRFTFTIPEPSSNGISGGDIGERNYRFLIKGMNPGVVEGLSEYTFYILPQGVVDHGPVRSKPVSSKPVDPKVTRSRVVHSAPPKVTKLKSPID